MLNNVENCHTGVEAKELFHGHTQPDFGQAEREEMLKKKLEEQQKLREVSCPGTCDLEPELRKEELVCRCTNVWMPRVYQ